jgi:hypothetical protein
MDRSKAEAGYYHQERGSQQRGAPSDAVRRNPERERQEGRTEERRRRNCADAERLEAEKREMDRQ